MAIRTGGPPQWRSTGGPCPSKHPQNVLKQ